MKVYKFSGVLIILVNAYLLLVASEILYELIYGSGIMYLVGFGKDVLVTVITLAIIGIFSGILTFINYKEKSKLFSILGFIVPVISLLTIFLSVR